MTKSQLIEKIATDTEQSPFDVRVIVEAYHKTVKATLASGENIYLRGFGTFKLRTQAPKRCRLVKANAWMLAPERLKPMFKPSQEFCEEVRMVAIKKVALCQ